MRRVFSHNTTKTRVDRDVFKIYDFLMDYLTPFKFRLPLNFASRGAKIKGSEKVPSQSGAKIRGGEI